MNNSNKFSALPVYARLTINRCNLPAEVLGDLSFQSNPKPLFIDGIAQLHKHLFRLLDNEIDADGRSQLFMQYMNAHFSLHSLSDAGHDDTNNLDRSRANYLRVLRGWHFNADSQEGAVIKSWVESRFGLIPRYHRGLIHNVEDHNYILFKQQSSRGLYNTNALEAQLDLLYSFCQYELARRYPQQNIILLYRGQNKLDAIERVSSNLADKHKSVQTLLLNNISSFTSETARASEFGDTVFSTEVPFAKLLFFSGLLPGLMTSEREYAVLGGIYKVNLLAEIIE